MKHILYSVDPHTELKAAVLVARDDHERLVEFLRSRCTCGRESCAVSSALNVTLFSVLPDAEYFDVDREALTELRDAAVAAGFNLNCLSDGERERFKSLDPRSIGVDIFWERRWSRTKVSKSSFVVH